MPKLKKVKNWKELFIERQAQKEKEVTEKTNHKLDIWQDSALNVFKELQLSLWSRNWNLDTFLWFVPSLR